MTQDKANWLFVVAWAKYKPELVMPYHTFDRDTLQKYEVLGYIQYKGGGYYSVREEIVIKKANQRA